MSSCRSPVDHAPLVDPPQALHDEPIDGQARALRAQPARARPRGGRRSDPRPTQPSNTRGGSVEPWSVSARFVMRPGGTDRRPAAAPGLRCAGRGPHQLSPLDLSTAHEKMSQQELIGHARRWRNRCGPCSRKCLCWPRCPPVEARRNLPVLQQEQTSAIDTTARITQQRSAVGTDGQARACPLVSLGRSPLTSRWSDVSRATEFRWGNRASRARGSPPRVVRPARMAGQNVDHAGQIEKPGARLLALGALTTTGTEAEPRFRE